MTEENLNQNKEHIVEGILEDEMKSAYLDYAMSVIIGRALPDVKDGLKPVHRRILYAMNDMGIVHNKPYKKCARIVGEVLGKYHPHGDTAVYDSLVRMAQGFSLRYPLIQGQGNFGSVDGDNAAAMRYCITGDSLLLTDKGFLSLGDISNKVEEKTKFEILSMSGKKNKSLKFFNSGKHKTIKINTSKGYELEGSFNHPILTWRISSNLKPIISWKLLEEVNVDDVVILNRNQGLFSKKSHDLKKYWPTEGFRNNITLPKTMNSDLAFLLGALVSEGSYHNKQIQFVNSDKEFYAKVKTILETQFPNIQLYERSIKGNCEELSIYEQKVVNFLENIGLKKVKSDKKVIPHGVLKSKKKDVKEFLKALFEGDGHVSLKIDKRHKGKSIELNYNSKSDELIKQLKIVLLNFGIVSNKKWVDKRNGVNKLSITSFENIAQFQKEINFFSKRKIKALSNIKQLNSTRINVTDFIPFISDYIRNKYDSKELSRFNFDRYSKLENNKEKLFKFIDSEDKRLIKDLLKNKYLFLQITEKDISKKPKTVYSIKVDSKCHSFVANGFINHNTESRMSKMADEMLKDIEKNTVNTRPNFDESLEEPIVLPARIPNLLVNGSNGIAVGMATNIPPHNLTETVNGALQVLDNPDLEIEDLFESITGPDFPTGGIILGNMGIRQAYLTGRGKYKVRAKLHIEELKGRKRIIITEIPYQLNKSLLLEQIANEIKDKRVEGISDIRDESDRKGMRIVLELKRDANEEVVQNQLYKHTRVQIGTGIIFLAIVNNQPKVLNLKEMLTHFINHRKDVVTRRTAFDLKKAYKKAHLLEGLTIALNNIDAIIKLIKSAETAAIAKEGLKNNYTLSDDQSQAILDMKLQKLTGLEQDKIRQEYEAIKKIIQELESILASTEKIKEIVRNELLEIREKYGDERKTQIVEFYDDDLDMEDLIPSEDQIITISGSGYIKRIDTTTYRVQNRGGKGVIGATTKDDDILEHIFIANTHSYLLVFTNTGRVHWLKVWKIPEGSRQSKGKAIVNLINLENDEHIASVIPIKEFDDEHYLVLATEHGIVKKTNLKAYSKPRQGGIIGITLDEGDKVINAVLTNGNQELMIATKKGQAVRFDEKDARPIGRTSRGVRGIRLSTDDLVMSLILLKPDQTILTITENGYGKRTKIEEYRLINRGGKGVRNIICSERNGSVVVVKGVEDIQDILLISQQGIIIRTAISQINVIGRNTQGVRLMRLKTETDRVQTATVAEKEELEEDNVIEETKSEN